MVSWSRAFLASPLIPNQIFPVRFGGISVELSCRAMVRIFARCSRAKILKAKPNEPEILPKSTDKVGLGIISLLLIIRTGISDRFFYEVLVSSHLTFQIYVLLNSDWLYFLWHGIKWNCVYFTLEPWLLWRLKRLRCVYLFTNQTIFLSIGPRQ